MTTTPETDAAAYARITDLEARATDAGDFETALKLAHGAHALAPTSARDIGNLARLQLLRRSYRNAATWFERVLASGLVDSITIRFVIFASAQSGSACRLAFWTARLPAIAAVMPPGPDAAFLSQLANIVTGYAAWSAGLSAPPPIAFFDEDDETEDQRFLRKALLACAQGLLQRALQLLSTMALKADAGATLSVVRGDVEILQARIYGLLGIDRSQLGTGPERGILLIRGHSSGFTADMFHVAVQLLIAELARRRPVVYWGRESGYWRPESGNLWTDFFDPIGATSLAEIARDARSFYPPFFSASNLSASQNRAWHQCFDGAGHEAILGRSEDVAVAERFSSLPEILALVPSTHPWRKASLLTLLKSVFDRYVAIRADLAAQHADWLDKQAQGRPVFAVQYRLQTSSKLLESADGRFVTKEQYFECIDAFIARDPEARIFMLTDYEPALEAFRRRYGERIICHGAERLTVNNFNELQTGFTKTEGNYHLAE